MDTRSLSPLAAMVLALGLCSQARLMGEDWAMRGRDASRNAMSPETHAPTDWAIQPVGGKPGKNIRWSAPLGSVSWGGPVVSHGLVWVGSNNAYPRDPMATQDAGVLMCFREQDGKFLYQYVCPRHEAGKRYDWEYSPICSSPLVIDDRLWFCTNRAEVVCLDIAPLITGTGSAEVLWKLDMMRELGVRPSTVMIGNDATHCSPAAYRNYLYVNTTNGKWYDGKVSAPNAPSLVCLDQETGRVVWEDHSPGYNILHIQQGSPLVVEIGGQGQVIMGQGDGWLRSFDALTGQLLWKFDINYKASRDKTYPQKAERWRTFFLAIPVYYNGRIYAAPGEDAEHGAGPGRLVCLDPTRRGDISSELDDGAGGGKPNPNSGLVWEYLGKGTEAMHLTMSSVAIHHALLIAPDYEGLVHCLNPTTGEHYWSHDTKGHIHGSPLIVDGKVYVGNEEGEVHILPLSREKHAAVEVDVDWPIGPGMVFANGVLYMMTNEGLFAIQEPADAGKSP